MYPIRWTDGASTDSTPDLGRPKLVIVARPIGNDRWTIDVLGPAVVDVAVIVAPGVAHTAAGDLAIEDYVAAVTPPTHREALHGSRLASELLVPATPADLVDAAARLALCEALDLLGGRAA